MHIILYNIFILYLLLLYMVCILVLLWAAPHLLCLGCIEVIDLNRRYSGNL